MLLLKLLFSSNQALFKIYPVTVLSNGIYSLTFWNFQFKFWLTFNSVAKETLKVWQYLEMANCRPHVTTCNYLYVTCTFDLLVFKVIWGLFWECTCPKIVCNTKRLTTERNGLIFETLGTCRPYVVSPFDLVGWNTGLKPFDALVSEWHVTRNWL